MAISIKQKCQHFCSYFFFIFGFFDLILAECIHFEESCFTLDFLWITVSLWPSDRCFTGLFSSGMPRDPAALMHY